MFFCFKWEQENLLSKLTDLYYVPGLLTVTETWVKSSRNLFKSKRLIWARRLMFTLAKTQGEFYVFIIQGPPNLYLRGHSTTTCTKFYPFYFSTYLPPFVHVTKKCGLFFLAIHIFSTPYPKLYIPSTLNIDLILWHTQLIVCA